MLYWIFVVAMDVAQVLHSGASVVVMSCMVLVVASYLFHQLGKFAVAMSCVALVDVPFVGTAFVEGAAHIAS